MPLAFLLSNWPLLIYLYNLSYDNSFKKNCSAEIFHITVFHEYILVISRRMIDSMFVFYPITLAPNGIKESLAILKNCLPNGIPTIVIPHMHPAKTQAKPPSNPPNINQRILPIVLMTTHPYPMFNILLQFPLLSHISL